MAKTQNPQTTETDTDLLAGLDTFATCQLCGLDTAELYTRLDLTDNTEIDVCETCADTADDLGHTTD